MARASPPTDTDKTAAEVDVDAIVKDLQEKVPPLLRPRTATSYLLLNKLLGILTR